MKQFSRFLIALALVVIMVLTANQVWASPKFAGSIPTSPPKATNVPLPTDIPFVPTVIPLPTVQAGIPVTGNSANPVNMGTAIFTAEDPFAKITVTKQIDEVLKTLIPPEGEKFLSDVFKLETIPADTPVEICYAYTPEMEAAKAEVKKLNQEVIPNVWVVVPEPRIFDGKICVTVTQGYLSLTGK